MTTSEEITLQTYDDMLDRVLSRNPEMSKDHTRVLVASLTHTALMAGGLKAIRDQLEFIGANLIGSIQ